MRESPNIAICIPCYNEASTIMQVIQDFKRTLPTCTVYVYDNNSSDRTATIAKQAGAITRCVMDRGKGNVVRRMFADIEADIYILVDGDSTYDASSAPQLIQKLVDDHLDMVVATRVTPSSEKNAYRLGHRFGNRLFNNIVSLLFGSKFHDIFSGYRAFSRRFVKSFPAESQQFEIETELSIHALELRIPSAEIPLHYGSRPQGSQSKLHSLRDGLLILWKILIFLKESRPMLLFGVVFLLLASFSIGIVLPIFKNYIHTGLVPRLPTAVLSTGMMLLAFMSLACGIILDNVARARLAVRRLFYLSLSS